MKDSADLNESLTIEKAKLANAKEQTKEAYDLVAACRTDKEFIEAERDSFESDLTASNKKNSLLKNVAIGEGVLLFIAAIKLFLFN